MFWTLCLGLALFPLILLPGSLYAPRFVAMMGLCALLGLACVLRPFSFSGIPFVWPLAIYVFVAALQAGRSLNPDAASVMLFLQIGGAFVGLAAARAIGDVVPLLRFAALGGIAVSAAGILEYLGVAWAQWPSAGRPSATLGFRNVAGMYLAVSLPLCAALGLQRARKDARLGIAAAGLMAVFLIFTRSRGAWLGTGAAFVVGVFLAWRTGGASLMFEIWRRVRGQWLGWVLVAGLCAGAIFVPPQFADRSPSRLDEKKAQVSGTVASIARSGGDRRRLDIWRHTLAIMADSPLFGVGLNNWSAYYPKYDGGDVMGIVTAPDRPHNDYLWIGSELGLVGLGAYLWLLWAVFRAFLRRLHTGGDAALPILCIGMGAVALLVHSAFSFPREQVSAMFPFWVAIGLIGRGQSAGRPGGWGARAFGALGIVLGLAGVWVGVRAVYFDLHLNRAIAAQAAGDTLLQLKAAQQAHGYGLFDHRVLLLKGLGQAALGEYGQAVQTYRNYVLVQPYLPGIYNNLGRAYDGLGDLDAAEAAYAKGLETFSGDGQAILLSNLAAVYKKQGRVDEALALYEQTVRLPADGRHNLGLIYAERGAFKKAIEAYAQALVQAPDMAIAYFSLGGVRMLSGDFERAAVDYETFLERWDGAQDYVRDAHLRLRQMYPVLGDRYVKSGDWQGAERVYRRLLDLGVETPDVYANLSMIEGRAGRYEAALSAGQKALLLDGEFAPAHFALATVYDQMHRRTEALDHYRWFVALREGGDPLVARAKARISALAR